MRKLSETNSTMRELRKQLISVLVAVAAFLFVSSAAANLDENPCLSLPAPGHGFVNDYAGCEKYFSCIAFLPFRVSCPPGFYFDEGRSVCDLPANVNCNICPSSGIHAVRIFPYLFERSNRNIPDDRLAMPHHAPNGLCAWTESKFHKNAHQEHLSTALSAAAISLKTFLVPPTLAQSWMEELAWLLRQSAANRTITATAARSWLPEPASPAWPSTSTPWDVCGQQTPLASPERVSGLCADFKLWCFSTTKLIKDDGIIISTT